MKTIDLPSGPSRESAEIPQQKFIYDQTKDKAYERLKFHQRKLRTAHVFFQPPRCFKPPGNVHSID